MSEQILLDSHTSTPAHQQRLCIRAARSWLALALRLHKGFSAGSRLREGNDEKVSKGKFPSSFPFPPWEKHKAKVSRFRRLTLVGFTSKVQGIFFQSEMKKGQALSKYRSSKAYILTTLCLAFFGVREAPKPVAKALSSR